MSNILWESKLQVKKGNLGEKIVQTILEEKGYIVYKSITEKAHAFDFLAIKNKKVFIISEVKSKARLNIVRATGIDVRHYNEYLSILDDYKIDVVLFFVDEHPLEQRVYCQKLSKLRESKIIDGNTYPNFTILKKKNIVLFHLDEMKEVKKLNESDLLELKIFSTRKHDFL